MKQAQLIITLLISLFSTGCFVKQQTKQQNKQQIVITVKASHKEFHKAFTSLPKHAEGIFTFQGTVNGTPTSLHFFHGSYRGFTLKNAPSTGRFVVCHAAYQPKEIQNRAVLVAEGRTRLVLLSSTSTTLTFKVVEAKHLPFQRKLVEQEEEEYAASLKDMGTITLK